jgi:hypothetical protein
MPDEPPVPPFDAQAIRERLDAPWKYHSTDYQTDLRACLARIAELERELDEFVNL